MTIKDKNEIFSKLYSDVDGYKISWEARNKLSDEENKNLIYGELNLQNLEKVFISDKIANKLENSKVFYDLGSGSGKVVISSNMLLNNLEKFIGVELLKELYDASNLVKESYSLIDKESAEKVNFINENFFNVDLTDADIIFLHYPIKDGEELYLKLEDKFFDELKSGTLILSAIRKLHNTDSFPLVDKRQIPTSYGDVTFYYHVKI